ncbi:MAG: cobalt-precorrin-5B (C(1))-methyltransferase [Deltaproteobacteria bacterium]|nr:cobalt-precorrin-5B (C(1))-methyltransferase [Deltaproteobacteria bacterium]
MKRNLRKGFTTGACAAAASKAAAIAFLTKKKVKDVQITLPIGKTITLPVHKCKIEKDKATASIIKDAGDDPDVTNGAEIIAEVFTSASSKVKSQKSKLRKAFQFTANSLQFTVFGGKGIGIVTKPGLAISVGEPAINPVPRKMIEDAIREAITNYELRITNLKSRIISPKSQISVVISVSNGEEIAKKTMNPRLGIIGGISILGTTGIVEPLSLSAYRHSITCAMDVAIAAGCKELVFSTGRSSEKTAEKELNLPQEAFILVGDHMGFALKQARGRREVGWAAPTNTLHKITIAGQFGKFSKLAAGHFETHCSDSSVELEFLAGLAKKAGAKKNIIEDIKNANTARQVFFILKENGLEKVFKMVCEKVKENSSKIADIKIGCILVGYEGEVAIKT